MVLVAVFIALCARIYISVTGAPMWNRVFTYLFLVSDSITATFAASCLISISVQSTFPTKEVTMIFILAICVAALLVFVKTQVNDSYVTASMNDIKTPSGCLYYIHMVISLYLNLSYSEESKNKLLGALLIHQEQCEDDECKCQEVPLYKGQKEGRLIQSEEGNVQRPT